MILPALNGFGEAADATWRDARVPRRFPDHGEATVLERHRKTEACPDGRHLWDLLEATGEYHPHEDDGQAEGHIDVRMTGTCVRCGVIWRMAGTVFDEPSKGASEVDPVPLRAGDLRAQEVDHNTWFGRADPRCTYSVHAGDDPTVLGWVSWGATLRGRTYYAGRLASWPDGQSIEAPTAIACLRKVAKAVQG